MNSAGDAASCPSRVSVQCESDRQSMALGPLTGQLCHTPSDWNVEWMQWHAGSAVQCTRTISMVSGTRGICPAVKRRPFTMQPCAYGPMAAGAAAVATVFMAGSICQRGTEPRRDATTIKHQSTCTVMCREQTKSEITRPIFAWASQAARKQPWLPQRPRRLPRSLWTSQSASRRSVPLRTRTSLRD
jgi:hypothetical protein